jgi:HMGL-like
MRMADDVVSAARGRGLFTTITLATAFGCPFEGEVDPARVAEFARRAADSGMQELCLADTVGVGAPSQVHDLTARFRDTAPDGPALRFHFHNTRNTGFANAYAAVTDGVDVLDASAGGIGRTRSLRRQRATSRPTTSCTCSTGWAARAGSAWRRCCPRRASCPNSWGTKCRRWSRGPGCFHEY